MYTKLLLGLLFSIIAFSVLGLIVYEIFETDYEVTHILFKSIFYYAIPFFILNCIAQYLTYRERKADFVHFLKFGNSTTTMPVGGAFRFFKHNGLLLDFMHDLSSTLIELKPDKLVIALKPNWHSIFGSKLTVSASHDEEFIITHENNIFYFDWGYSLDMLNAAKNALKYV